MEERIESIKTLTSERVTPEDIHWYKNIDLPLRRSWDSAKLMPSVKSAIRKSLADAKLNSQTLECESTIAVASRSRFAGHERP